MKKYIFMSALLVSSLVGFGQNLKQVNYNDKDQKLSGLITSNFKNKNLPAVLILPAWKGIDQEAKQAAVDLEKQGYIVFIADIYGVGNIPQDNAAAGKLAGQYKSDYKAYQHRIRLALNELVKQRGSSSRVAVIGYCFGGTGALEAARSNMPIEGAVSIHGGLAKAADRTNTAITTKVLIEHPADDKSVSAEDLINIQKELKEGKTDFQIITYANSGHTFTNPESADYNPTMASRAWKHLLMFLEEVLQVK